MGALKGEIERPRARAYFAIVARCVRADFVPSQLSAWWPSAEAVRPQRTHFPPCFGIASPKRSMSACPKTRFVIATERSERLAVMKVPATLPVVERWKARRPEPGGRLARKPL